MSYARFSEGSDVYVYLDAGGFFTCCACGRARKSPWPQFSTTDAIVAHLQEHLQEGDEIPEHTIPGLLAEAEQNDAWIREQATARGWARFRGAGCGS